ncbi:glycosyltransferase [Bacillus sp. FJAT-29790]|uniref:glycosyltransferase n=1 Tax=Bacillus sp. FJAT-29790 TaxID=1895002 RepID=UPI001C24C8C6|nr:glycosyltransferase [Bacillus sp. FJAT-29790]MBU8879389.1 glycosyltransferase [Bacillus sp. FJAT-29790]
MNSCLISSEKLDVFWKLSSEKKKIIEAYFGEPFSSMVKALRIYDVTSIIFDGGNAHSYQDVILADKHTNWTFKGLKSYRSYCVEYGIMISEYKFFPMLRSTAVHHPLEIRKPQGELQAELESDFQDANHPPIWAERVSTYSYYENVNEAKKCSALYKGEQVQIKADRQITSTQSEMIERDNQFPVNIFFKEQVDTLKKRKGKILLLTWEYPPHIVGGLARHVHGLAGGLIKQGYEVHVITANPAQLLHEELVEGICIHRVKPLMEKDHDFLNWIAGLNLAMEQKARELARIHRFALVHAHDWLVGACAISLQASLHVPMIATIHATEHGRNKGIHTELQKFIHEKESQLMNESNSIIVCSEYMKCELIQVFDVSEQKIWIIPNGVVGIESTFGEEILAALPVQQNKRIIFSIGRIVHEKGFDTLIDAALVLQDYYPDVYFIIAGKGPMLSEYRNRVLDRGLQDRVYFVGFVTDDQRNALFEKCSLAVFPSRYEPFGIVALEAMIMGKPVIVSNTGGLKGIVQHKQTGLLMTPGDVGSFLEQAAIILDHEEVGQQMGWNGKKEVERLFSWVRIAEDTKRVYEEAISNCKI